MNTGERNSSEKGWEQDNHKQVEEMGSSRRVLQRCHATCRGRDRSGRRQSQETAVAVALAVVAHAIQVVGLQRQLCIAANNRIGERWARQRGRVALLPGGWLR